MLMPGWQESFVVVGILLVISGPLLVAYIIARSVVKSCVKQEIDCGMERMEKRIETLEKILLDRSKSDDRASESLDQKEL